jgi:hypothetical protein
VHVLIVRVVRVDAKLRGGSSQVALSEEVYGTLIVDEDPYTNIELTLIY